MIWDEKFLLAQIEDLKAERDEFKQRYFSLVEKITEKPQTISTIKPVHQSTIRHNITKIENWAKCECGWEFKSDDPAQLQTAISGHYAKQAVKPKKRDFTAYKNALELQAEAEARQKEILQ